MPRRREIPFSPIPLHVETDDGNAPIMNEYSVLGIPLRPSAAEDPLQALMECAPHQSPQWSKAELYTLREAIADAIDDLEPRERFIFDACVIERKAIRHVAAELSLTKSYVHRILHCARAKLAIALSEVPVIQEYLSR